MVTSRERFFLVCGNNFLQKQKAIDNITSRALKQASRPVNLVSFYSRELDIKALYREIYTSAFEGIKILILRNCDELDSGIREFLSEKLKDILARCCLVLDTEKNFGGLRKNKKIADDKFFRLAFKHAVCLKTSSLPEEVSLDDFRQSLRRNDLAASLYIADRLFEGTSRDRSLGPQILGMLTRKFSYIRDADKKDKIFSYLWCADRNLKEKGADTRLVVESLLVRLLGSRFL